MSLKAKLATTVAALCMVLCLLSVGVWAASKASVSMNASVSFTAKDISADITGTVALDGADIDESKYTATLDETTDPAEGDTLTLSAWTISNVDFTNKTSEVVITLKVENKNAERAIKATFAPTLGGTAITATEFGDYTNRTGYASATVKNNVAATFNSTIAAVSDVYTIPASGSITYTINLKVNDRNLKVDSSLATIAGTLALENVAA